MSDFIGSKTDPTKLASDVMDNASMRRTIADLRAQLAKVTQERDEALSALACLGAEEAQGAQAMTSKPSKKAKKPRTWWLYVYSNGGVCETHKDAKQRARATRESGSEYVRVVEVLPKKAKR